MCIAFLTNKYFFEAKGSCVKIVKLKETYHKLKLIEILRSHWSGAKESGEICVRVQCGYTSKANDQGCSNLAVWAAQMGERLTP